MNTGMTTMIRIMMTMIITPMSHNNHMITMITTMDHNHTMTMIILTMTHGHTLVLKTKPMVTFITTIITGLSKLASRRATGHTSFRIPPPL